MKTVSEPVLFTMISPISNIHPAHSRHSKKYLLSNYSVPDTLIGSEDPTESTTFWWKEANKQRYGGWRSKWHYFLQKKILLLRNSSCLPQGHIASEWWCQDSHPDLLPLNPRFHHWVSLPLSPSTHASLIGRFIQSSSNQCVLLSCSFCFFFNKHSLSTDTTWTQFHLIVLINHLSKT